MTEPISQIPAAPTQPKTTAGPVVSVGSLCKNFSGRTAVDNISFAIQPGECLGFLGPNGAGKTTTINILLGLVRKTSGKISLLGREIPEFHRQVKRLIGVVPQADSLDPDLTVAENLLTYAGYFNIPRKIALKKADELLHFFALHNRRDEIIDHLSGGQRRRLLLARALINDPQLLILDEPTIGLDPQARHLMWERLEILREQGTTMLLTSHYLDEVSRLSNRVLIMDKGRIVAQGEPQQLIMDLVGLEVFEVEGSIAELDELAASFSDCDATIERAYGNLYIYTREKCDHLEKLLARTSRWVRRPANLEDLFIQLTGRSLRES
ncbi:MAG: ATP-binding cassette domain-containing protein [Proteobacteria bacterium]|nr:ATP-binding cassette domain-containing protein [Pseudomonadota bacterium]MBU1739762.1 ATP-binding cassette domain-containing protein [Pseudomonadota bacterium]